MSDKYKKVLWILLWYLITQTSSSELEKQAIDFIVENPESSDEEVKMKLDPMEENELITVQKLVEDVDVKTEEDNQLIQTNSIEENKITDEEKIVDVIQPPTPMFYCHPFPSQDTEKYPISLEEKEQKLFMSIVHKYIENMQVFLAADGELVSVTLKSVLGSGGSKNAVSFVQDGKESNESEEVLMLPNVNLAMWHRIVEEEVKVSEEMSKLGILNVQSKRTDLYLEREDAAKIFFASYKCPSFKSLAAKGIFVVDIKNSGSSTWPRKKSLINLDDKKYNVDTWKPLVEPLAKDLYKLVNNNLIFGSDSSNFAIQRTENTNPEYVIRYFGFDFSSKAVDQRDRKFGKPQRDE